LLAAVVEEAAWLRPAGVGAPAVLGVDNCDRFTICESSSLPESNKWPPKSGCCCCCSGVAVACSWCRWLSWSIVSSCQRQQASAREWVRCVGQSKARSPVRTNNSVLVSSRSNRSPSPSVKSIAWWMTRSTTRWASALRSLAHSCFCSSATHTQQGDETKYRRSENTSEEVFARSRSLRSLP